MGCAVFEDSGKADGLVEDGDDEAQLAELAAVDGAGEVDGQATGNCIATHCGRFRRGGDGGDTQCSIADHGFDKAEVAGRFEGNAIEAPQRRASLQDNS